MIHSEKHRDIYITADEIEIGEGATLGEHIDIRVHGTFSLGDRSYLHDVRIRGNNVQIGSDVYQGMPGLYIGGGGCHYPNANLEIGDRCTIHDNFINVNEPVTIRDDVGLSPGVHIITHGFWLSVLEGFPAKFAGVTIEDGVIVGWRSTILAGVHIGERTVVGAESVVTKSLASYSVYAGNPAKFIRDVISPSSKCKRKMLVHILQEYQAVAAYHGIEPRVANDYPVVVVNQCRFDVETLTFEGQEDVETDDFRDYVRRWGLRFYSERPFRSVWRWS